VFQTNERLDKQKFAQDSLIGLKEFLLVKGFWRYPIPSLLLFTVLVWTLAACGDSTSSNGSNTAQQGTPGTPGAYTCVQESITMSGSTTLQRLAQTVADKYEAKCSGSHITVNYGGSKAGLADVEAGKVAIGNSDIYADKTTQGDLVDHQVAVAPFAILINPKVGVKGLTTAQVKDIYSGKVTNWEEVGGPNMKIVVVDRTASSGTRATFEQYILGGPETVTVPPNLTSDRNGTVLNYITQNDGAIGYGSPSSREDTNVVVATLDGNAPTADLVKNNTYKFWNIEHMYTKGKPSDLAQAVIDYATSAELKAATTRLNFIALSDMDQAALKTHQPAS
jgi:phosphate transport system substrate-binding protein